MPPWLATLLGTGVIDKVLSFIPNPAERAKAQLDLQTELMRAGISSEADQRAINKVEASSASLFVAGWRPAVGWICVSTLGWAWVVAPMLTWLVTVIGLTIPALPELSVTDAITLLTALLGMGSMRTFEKVVSGEGPTKSLSGILVRKLPPPQPLHE